MPPVIHWPVSQPPIATVAAGHDHQNAPGGKGILGQPGGQEHRREGGSRNERRPTGSRSSAKTIAALGQVRADQDQPQGGVQDVERVGNRLRVPSTARPHARPGKARRCPGRWRTDSAEPAGRRTFAALGSDLAARSGYGHSSSRRGRVAVFSGCTPEGPAVTPGLRRPGPREMRLGLGSRSSGGTPAGEPAWPAWRPGRHLLVGNVGWWGVGRAASVNRCPYTRRCQRHDSLRAARELREGLLGNVQIAETSLAAGG